MKILRDKIPKATRPLEFVSFFTMKLKTKEGPAYSYFAVDDFTEFAFNTGIEIDENPETILKHIYLLMEDKDFVKHIDKGFTLVLADYQDLSDRINAIISSVNGKLIYDREFNQRINLPVIQSFGEFLRMW